MDNTKARLADLTVQERALLEQRLLSRLQPKQAQAGPQDDSPKPLSLAQESLWFFDQLVPNTPLYNIPQAFRLRGKLHPQALQIAFDTLVQRHHALRTQFVSIDGNPMQLVRTKPFLIQVLDLSSWPRSQQEKEAARLLEEEAKRPFRLTEDSMIRANLLTLAAEEFVLTITCHHIVADFASLAILYDELATLYTTALEARPPRLPDVSLQFPDWAARERRRVESGALNASLDYWKGRLAGQPPVLDVPTDRPRTASRAFHGARRPVHLPAALTTALQALADREGVTRYMLLLAAFQTLLHRYAGQDDVLVGSPMANRADPDTQRMVGFLVNTVVMRTGLSGEFSFRELLRRVREVTIGAFAHQEAPFEKVVEQLHGPRQPGSNPLCQVMFQYLASASPVPQLPGISVEPLPMETGTAKFDLTLTLLESENGLGGDLEYNSDLFNPSTVDRMLGNFRVLLQGIIANPGERLGLLPLLTSAEREQVLVTWNQTAASYPRETTVPQLFEEQVDLSPDAVALLVDDQALSYSQLNRQSNQLARFLVRSGVQPKAPVGLCLERSRDMIIALLAILKAGAAYVPFDPNYPAERRSLMLRDSGVSLLITTSQFLPLWPGTRLVLLDGQSDTIARERDDNLAVPVTADDLAYVMFTSGSTGQPKGVAVPHRAVARLVKNTNYAEFRTSDVFLQFAPLSFDASTFEIWGPLLNGARLVIYPPQFESLEQFVHVLQRFQVTTLWLTAGLFHQVVDQHLDGLKTVRQLLAGGDVLSVPHVMQVLRNLPGCQLINGYGPTENTTFTCCYPFPRDWPGTSSAPIGRPIHATQVYLLDPYLAPVPIGVTGELCIAGDGLARGYVNSPELTAQKFVPNPFSSNPESRLYRTGDRARYLPDGTIEFLGRMDDQVKINGFRIHLGEVEAALTSLTAVRQAVVMALPGPAGSKQLVAYVVPGQSVSSAEIRQAVAEKLPSYMVPSHVVLLNELPLTAHGKPDRQSLPPPTPAAPQLMPEPTLNPAQQKIAEIWKEVFQRDTVRLDDNFFDLGGHSLLAMRVVSRLNQAFAANLMLGTLFEAPTVRALAEKISQAAHAPRPGPIPRRAKPAA